MPEIAKRGEGTLKDGYRLIGFGTKGNGGNGIQIAEHRLVMERILGRPLKRHETVHHVDGQRANNRIDGPLMNWRSGNLELWSTWQPSGQRVADKVAFAVALLREYAPDLLARPSGEGDAIASYPRHPG